MNKHCKDSLFMIPTFINILKIGKIMTLEKIIAEKQTAVTKPESDNFMDAYPELKTICKNNLFTLIEAIKPDICVTLKFKDDSTNSHFMFDWFMEIIDGQVYHDKPDSETWFIPVACTSDDGENHFKIFFNTGMYDGNLDLQKLFSEVWIHINTSEVDPVDDENGEGYEYCDAEIPEFIPVKQRADLELRSWFNGWYNNGENMLFMKYLNPELLFLLDTNLLDFAVQKEVTKIREKAAMKQ